MPTTSRANALNTTQVRVTCHACGKTGGHADTRRVVREAPLVIHVNRETHYTLMRTPGEDRDLAVGFLFTEGVIDALGQIHVLRECPDNPNLIEVAVVGPAVAEGTERNMVVSSSCGLCGHTDIEGLVAGLPAATGVWELPVEVLFELPGSMRTAQSLFEVTGATHAAAIFNAQGVLDIVREDIGRHCAFDKAIGHALLAGVNLRDRAAFLSGRVSLEMIVKAARAGLPVVAAVSAPTAAAVEAAQRLGITLCGFVRGRDATVYTHSWRIRSVHPETGAAPPRPRCGK